MSRTEKDLPWRVWKKRHRLEAERGYPAPIGGAWPGRARYARVRNRSHRFAEKRAIINNQELPTYKKEVPWDVW